MKPKAHYSPDTDSMMIVLADHPGTESEEVADNVVVTFDGDNNIIAIEIVTGARDIFADLIAKVGKPARAKSVKSA